jgi:hypothetical protein
MLINYRLACHSAVTAKDMHALSEMAHTPATSGVQVSVVLEQKASFITSKSSSHMTGSIPWKINQDREPDAVPV